MREVTLEQRLALRSWADYWTPTINFLRRLYPLTGRDFSFLLKPGNIPAEYDVLEDEYDL